MVGAVGEITSGKRRKLWKTGEDGLCCSSSAIQTQPGPSSLLEEWSKTPIVFCCFLCVVGYPPKCGKRPKYINRECTRSTKAAAKTPCHHTYPQISNSHSMDLVVSRKQRQNAINLKDPPNKPTKIHFTRIKINIKHGCKRGMTTLRRGITPIPLQRW